MKMIRLTAVLFLVCFFQVSISLAAKAADIVTVKVKGVGTDKDSALKDALRKAVEKGGNLKIYSQSKTENYELIKDTILAQASGLIKDYKILRKGEDVIGGYFVQVEARVDRKIIDATWGQVEILLKQLGRPKILVNFVERIYDVTLPPSKRERVDADSLLANNIEEMLTEKGFELVDKNQIDALKRNKLAKATLEKDMATIKQLAGELGAQMFIVGNSRGSGPQITNAYGTRLYMWETDVTLKAYWSETAQILFARSEVGSRSGSRVPGPPGCKKAIQKAGGKLARQCLHAILQKWSKMAVGGGKVVLEVKPLTFKAMVQMQKALEKVKDVKEVRRNWNKPMAKFEITTTDSAETFSEKLIDLTVPGITLEIEDQKFNTIIITAKPTKKD